VIGRVFDDRYEIVRRLGSGGMSDVYLAKDRHLGRQVALKVLHSRLAEDEQFIERFRREASSAAGLSHPNIVQIYDRGEAEGTYYIAMEYLEGRTLKDIIQAHAPLRPEHIVSVSSQILEALRFAHRRDIIHRDIKPHNIIVDDEGRVKVTDFGIARAGSEARMTDTGSILGTAHYLSPEQAAGGRVEPSSDLYSLGVVMYEMATGRLPFTGDNPVAIAMKHLNEAPVPPGDVNSALPENLEHVILRALGKQPDRRYTTADAFQEDLRRVEAGQMVAAPMPFLPDDEATRVMGRVAPTQETMVRPGPPRAPAHPGYDERRRAAGAVVAAEERRSRIWPWLLVLLFLLLLGAAVYALVGQLRSGEDLVVVPDLYGMTEEQARDTVERVGLTLEVDEERRPSNEVEEGRVVDQEPAAEESQLPEGESVRVWLSAGRELVEVPDVVGREVSEAAVILSDAGLDVAGAPQQEPSDEVQAGRITRQDPPGGAEVEPGTAVTLWVSSGREVRLTTVPDVLGLTQEQAVRLLERRTLRADARQRESNEPAGRVIEQDPGPDNEVEEGSTVRIVISAGPPRVTVPDVFGQTEERARFLLGQAGLQVRTEQVEAEEPAGTVIAQEPPAQEQVEPNAVVTITVSTGPPETTTTTAVDENGATGALPPGLVGREQPRPATADRPKD
jgi:eukaryotic-like serine/threonine-protein kinase